jgi:chromosome segregation ATPase
VIDDMNLMLEIISIIFAAVLFGAGGWFLRHRLLQRALEQARKRLDEVHALLLNSQHEITANRHKLFEYEADNNRLQSKIKDVEQTKVDLDRHIQEIKSLKAQLASSQNDTISLENEIGRAQVENETFKKKHDTLSIECESLKKENDFTKDELQSLTAKFNAVQSELESLKRENAHLKMPSLDIQKQTSDATAASPESGTTRRTQAQSTEKFAPKEQEDKKDNKPKEDITSTGMRILKEFEKELRLPKNRRDSSGF